MDNTFYEKELLNYMHLKGDLGKLKVFKLVGIFSPINSNIFDHLDTTYVFLKGHPMRQHPFILRLLKLFLEVAVELKQCLLKETGTDYFDDYCDEFIDYAVENIYEKKDEEL